MKEENKIILFIDLLGYTKYLNDNEEDAISCLTDVGVISRLTDHFSDDVLMISDSVFAIFDNENINEKLNIIAEFLSSVFRYNRSSFGFDCDPEKFVYKEIKIDTKEVKASVHNDYPLLYRGALGILGIGDVYTAREKNTNIIKNLTGKNIANTIKLGEQGVGPRLYISKEVVDLLDDKMKNRVVYDADENKMYYLWPINYIGPLLETEKQNVDSICECFDMFNEMLEIVCKHYKENQRMSQIYLDLFDMFVRSYKQFLIENGVDLKGGLKGIIKLIEKCFKISRYEKLKNDAVFKNHCIERIKQIFK